MAENANKKSSESSSPRTSQGSPRKKMSDQFFCFGSSCRNSLTLKFRRRLQVLIGLLTILTWHFTRVYTTKSLDTLAYGLRYELLQRPLLRMWNILNSTIEVTTAQVKLSEIVIRRYTSQPDTQAQEVEMCVFSGIQQQVLSLLWLLILKIMLFGRVLSGCRQLMQTNFLEFLGFMKRMSILGERNIILIHFLNLKRLPMVGQKIVNLDNHIALACAGLKADARVLINKVRVECQSHRLTSEDPVMVEYITHYIAGLQQKYTQSGGVRPFGLSTLIVGFDPYTNVPALYQTDQSGTFSAWKANATGRNSNSIREFLEKNYKETSGQETVKLAIRALLEVVESGGKNLEVAVMTKEGLRQLEEPEIDAIAAEIEAEKAAAEAAKKAPSRDSWTAVFFIMESWFDYRSFNPLRGSLQPLL